jgi:hypothetical protein
MNARTVPRYCTYKTNQRKAYFYTTNSGLIKKNPVYNAKGFIGWGSNGFAHNGIFIPIAQMDVSFLLPCRLAYHITQKLLVPLFSVSMESDSTVRTAVTQ